MWNRLTSPPINTIRRVPTKPKPPPRRDEIKTAEKTPISLQSSERCFADDFRHGPYFFLSPHDFRLGTALNGTWDFNTLLHCMIHSRLRGNPVNWLVVVIPLFPLLCFVGVFFMFPVWVNHAWLNDLPRCEKCFWTYE